MPDIQTSLHGREIGLDVAGNLVLNKADGTQVVISGAGVGSSRVLAAGVPLSTLTGGTLDTKTTMLEIPLEDALLADFTGILSIEASFAVTRNTNNKKHGIDIGLTAGTAVTLRTRTVTSATIGADGYNIELRRHPTSPGQIAMTLGGALATWGTTNVDTASPVSAINVDPDLSGLKLFFWGQLTTNVSDVVTLGAYSVKHARVQA